MELLVSLTKISILNKLNKDLADGVIFGHEFSLKYNYSNEEILRINKICLDKGLKRYVSIDAFVGENDLQTLDSYMFFLTRINPDGIYFSDMAVIEAAKRYNLVNRLIYDPVTLTTNSNDIDFYLDNGIDVCLARELTLEEIVEIIKEHPYQLDMQIFGHLRMSYSKRKFLTNYFNEINKDIEYIDKDNLTLVEESRNYKLPIKETKYGTCIYTDYVLMMYEEYVFLKSLCKRTIVDSEFLDLDVLFDVLRDARRINPDNSEFLKNAFIQRHPEYTFSTGYLYQKTVNKKEENE